MAHRIRKARSAIIILAFALAAISSAAPEAQTAFSFTLSDVRLDAKGDPVLVELHGDHLTSEQMKVPAPVLTDSAKSPAVTFASQGEGPPGDNARTWVYLVTVAPKLDLNSTLTREADLRIGGADWSLRYTLTNKPAAPPVLTASAGNRAWAIWWDQGPTPRYQVLLSVTGAPTQHVRLGSSGIKNTKSPDSIDNLVLCDGAPNQTCGQFDISPGMSKTLYIEPQWRSPESPYGSFSGDVKFTGDGVDTPASLTIDVSATSALRRGIGIFAIGIGVVTSLILIVTVRARALRIQAEIPVAALRETIEKTIAAASQLPPVPDIDYTPVGNRLQLQLNRISGSAIDALLPPQVLPAFPGTSADNSASLKTLLENTGHVTASINILITQGMQPVAAQFPSDPAANAEVAAAVKTGLGALIQAAVAVATESDASTQLTQILANFERAMRPPAAQAVGQDAGPVVLKAARLLPQTVHQLQYKLDWLSLIVWAVWAAITIASGYVVLIDSSPGFGTWGDIILCAAWGLGINVAGDAAKSLTPGSISTGLGITLPKANS